MWVEGGSLVGGGGHTLDRAMESLQGYLKNQGMFYFQQGHSWDPLGGSHDPSIHRLPFLIHGSFSSARPLKSASGSP